MQKLKVGPVVGLESNSIYTVCFSSAVDFTQASVSINGENTPCSIIGATPSSTVWRAQIELPVSATDQNFSYQVFLNNELAQCQNKRSTWICFIPGNNNTPKFAYTSCNGFSSLDLMHKTQEPYQLWNEMAEQHMKEPLSLLLMGGDQLYADEIWSTVPELKKWSGLSFDERVSRKASKTLCEQIDRFYDKLYQERWTDKNMSLMLAQVPSIMMWDDHDIFDGWGSYPEKLHNCPVFQQIYNTAKHYFELFQIRSRNNTSLLDPGADHYAFALKFRDYHILALDNRAERTLNQVMGSSQWASVNKYLASMDNKGHLLVLSAVPVVYRDFSFTEEIMDHTPWEEELTDDLKDHWRAKEHQGERARLIHRLLENAERRKDDNASYKTVILSGDVHIGSVGVINNTATNCKIHQVVSSGIVHPAPSKLQWIGIMAVTNDHDEYLDETRDIHIAMLKPFASNKYIRCRNYVTLAMGNDKKLWVNWNSEGKDNPYYPIQ